MRQVIFRGKVVGEVDGPYYITQRKPEHFMRKFQGFGISKGVLGFLALENVQSIVIEYITKEKVITYICDLQKYIESNNKYIDGDDEQYFVSVEDLIKI